MNTQFKATPQHEATSMSEFIIGATNGRIVIIDALSVCIGNCASEIGRSADIGAMIERVIPQYKPNASFIVVSKQQYNDNNDYIALSKQRSNLMIIICGKSPCVKSNRAKHQQRVTNVYDMLAEADDHMIGLLTRVITFAGCAPHVMSHDKYRNNRDIMNRIPSYVYYTYINGVRIEHKMQSTEAWMEIMFPKLVGNVNKCTDMVMNSCSICLKCIYPACVTCSVCMYCRIKYVLKGPQFCKPQKLSS